MNFPNRKFAVIIKLVINHFLKKGEFRNYTLVVLGTCTALRISDLLGICWSEIYDAERDRFKVHVKITEQKHGKIKLIALNEQAIDALRLYYPHSHSDFVFVNNRKMRSQSAGCRLGVSYRTQQQN